jgi:hypothetical protein
VRNASPRTASVMTSGPGLVAGVEIGVPSESAAEWVVSSMADRLRGLGLRETTIGSHLMSTPGGLPRVALSICLPSTSDVDAGWWLVRESLPPGEPDRRAICLDERRHGPVALQRLALRAVHEHRERSAGRVIVFPGVEDLVGTVTLAQVLERTAVQRVVALGGGVLDPWDRLVTRGRVRPRWSHGELVLHVRQAAEGAVIPLEVVPQEVAT